MVEFCVVQKYSTSAYPSEYDDFFMFYDTISDQPIFFDGEFLFANKKDFLLYAEDSRELDRYTGKIPVRYGE